MVEEKKGTDWFVLALAGLGVWYFFLYKPHKCPYCDAAFKTKGELTAHIEAEHPGEPVPDDGNGMPQIQITQEWQTDYRRNETATCRVTLKNLSNFAATVYAQVFFGYKAMFKWYDGSSRDWVRFDLPALGQATEDGHPIVKSDCPIGGMVGRVVVYPTQAETTQLAYSEAPSAVVVVEATPEVQIISQSWL